MAHLATAVAPRTRVRRIPAATPLTWTYRATDFWPHSIGSDGVAYGHTGARRLARTTDGGQTLDLGRDMAAYTISGEYVVWCGRTTDGYVAVTSTDVSQAGNSGGIWFSSSFTGTFTKVQAINGTNEFSVSRPEIGPNGHTLLMVGEYSTDMPQPPHRLWLSLDGGQTWTVIKTAQVLDSSKNSHFHCCAYDPRRRRIWSSQGDNGNSMFAYSDDLGATWTGAPVPASNPLYQADSPHQQPTVLVVFGDRLAVTPDRGLATAVWSMSADTGTPPAMRWQTFRGEASQNMFGRSPFAQAGDVAVVPIPDRFAGTKKVYFVGTGDGGLSWHLLAEVDLTASGGAGTGLVGADSAGLMYWRSSGNSDPAGSNLLVASMPTWRDLPVPG